MAERCEDCKHAPHKGQCTFKFYNKKKGHFLYKCVCGVDLSGAKE